MAESAPSVPSSGPTSGPSTDDASRSRKSDGKTPQKRKEKKMDPLVRARHEKLARWRETWGITGYGERVDDLMPMRDARAAFDQAAHDAWSDADNRPADDPRAVVRVAGRCVQHRDMGKLVFMVLRDDSGDLQISLSRDDLSEQDFKIARKLDYGDVVVADGRMGKTQRGEVCVWASSFNVHAKSLVPPPEKYHGLQDAELRARHRYIDMYANPRTMRTFVARSKMLAWIRSYMHGLAYLEVETPMMQSQPGGAAARPFFTHHNTLDMPLSLRIAPELYLKRLLVGGMPKVYEIGRNFRNEGVDRSHNPEFTAIEVYEAFGDCWSMLDLTEGMLHGLAMATPIITGGDDADSELSEAAPAASRPFGDITIDYSRPFPRVRYGDLFEDELGFAMTDEAAVRARAGKDGIEDAENVDQWLLVNELFERHCEPALDPSRPTFITDYPSATSPLTRPKADEPHLAHRWELLCAGMELGTAYTELNDPEIQRAKFTEQLTGADDEETTMRNVDEDFLHALSVGMPPAGGLGLGIDRIVMLMTNASSIRDVILFPLLRPDQTT